MEELTEKANEVRQQIEELAKGKHQNNTMWVDTMDIFKTMNEYVRRNHYVDVGVDKVPVFLCSIGTHIFNGLNKCGVCPFIPTGDDNQFAIDSCILRHDNRPIYTPMSHVADTRLHIVMRGIKGSGKSILIVNLFLAPRPVCWPTKPTLRLVLGSARILVLAVSPRPVCSAR